MYWKSKWLLPMSEKERAQNTEPSTSHKPHVLPNTHLSGSKDAGTRRCLPTTGEKAPGFGGTVTGSTPRNPCFALDFQKLWVLLNLPVHSCAIQLNSFAKDACEVTGGREGIYEHEMGNYGSRLLFPAHSFSHFVTLKITTWPFTTKLGITNPTYYTQALQGVAADCFRRALGFF